MFASGAQTTSSATVGGSFGGNNGTLNFSGGAIGQDLSYQSKTNATGLSNVQVHGKTQRSDPPAPHAASPYAGGMELIVSLLSALVLGGALILSTPQRITSFLHESPASWTKWAVIGITALIVVPLVVLIALMTLVGWLAAVVLLLLYVIGLIVAHVYAYIYLGQSLLRRFERQQSLWVYLVVGVVPLYLLVHIPLLGPLLLLVFFVGIVLPAFGFLLSGLREQS